MDDALNAHLQAFVIDSNESLELRLVREIQDVDDEKTIFKPEMSHQVFGESETIFGYRDLKVKLYYSAGCLETYLGIDYTSKLKETTDQNVKADDVLQMLSNFLSSPVHYSLDSFFSSLVKDDTFVPAGELIQAHYVKGNNSTRKFEVYKAHMGDRNFKEYHKRMQTFILWYIDAANFLDVDDDQWHYFNMFERYVSASGSVRYATVGFATVYQYYAYPNHTRPRIAQVLILPPFQNIGLGAQLLRAIYADYIGRSEVKDITVEDPSPGFQRLRDYVDATNCSTLPSFQKHCLLQGFNKTMTIEARDNFKINKRQARRVYEILRLKVTNISNETEYRDYRLNVKRRLNIPLKREQRGLKNIELSSKVLNQGSEFGPEYYMEILEKEYRLLEEEYDKVIKRMENSAQL
ncbi:histone acetyltransferase type B catalytic subunit [Belonocnema kinseyi]|uniref:histone acetyltransferase type B catalytic subunit n=1 Tax=Belonocnema kinseyi TaxID=2817044 RepID=UPI00143D4525|nr:histone acetyltransferase type B catalytic subunit [Belonocnema kinseyi]XP_033217538.1 histone acetyltransferase type B catalytic subunit [Belonocnema kinseyi]